MPIVTDKGEWQTHGNNINFFCQYIGKEVTIRSIVVTRKPRQKVKLIQLVFKDLLDACSSGRTENETLS